MTMTRNRDKLMLHLAHGATLTEACEKTNNSVDEVVAEATQNASAFDMIQRAIALSALIPPPKPKAAAKKE